MQNAPANPDDYRSLLAAIEQWADAQRAALVFRGVRPAGNTPTTEAALREAAIARGNELTHAHELSEIESVAATMQKVLDAWWYEVPMPDDAIDGLRAAIAAGWRVRAPLPLGYLVERDGALAIAVTR